MPNVSPGRREVLAARGASRQYQALKSEARNPKAERRPKSETQKANRLHPRAWACDPPGSGSISASRGARAGISDFGFRTSAFFRPSGFGLRVSGLWLPEMAVLTSRARPRGGHPRLASGLPRCHIIAARGRNAPEWYQYDNQCLPACRSDPHDDSLPLRCVCRRASRRVCRFHLQGPGGAQGPGADEVRQVPKGGGSCWPSPTARPMPKLSAPAGKPSRFSAAHAWTILWTPPDWRPKSGSQSPMPPTRKSSAGRRTATSASASLTARSSISGARPANIFLFCEEAKARRAKAGNAPLEAKWKLTDHLKAVVEEAEQDRPARGSAGAPSHHLHGDDPAQHAGR